MTSASDANKRALRNAMVSAFGLEALEAQCLLEDAGIDLAVSLEMMVRGSGKTAIVMNLIEYFDRRGHLHYLVQAVRHV